MFTRLPRLVAVFAAVCAFLFIVQGRSSVAYGGFSIVRDAVAANHSARLVNVDLTFSQVPDFLSTDASGHPVDSFQIEFDGKYDGGPQPFSTFDCSAIVRGDEIHLADAIRLRDPLGDGGPDAGGWGPQRAALPFTLSGNTLSFTATFDQIGLLDGMYRYRVYAVEDGVQTSFREVRFVPLPAAAGMGAGGLLLAGGAGLVMRWRERRRL